MLIIFDLDDTLIDTSGSIVPKRLKIAFDRMVSAGLDLQDPKNQLENLLQINKKSISAKEALKEFLLVNDAIDNFFEIGLHAVYHEFDPTMKIVSRKGANKILNELKENHNLALVTIGNEQFQRQKLENAGIDFSLFSIIEVIEDEDKKPAYKKIIDIFEKKASETLVCGDKVRTDLIPAKELSCITVHMQYGRGKNVKHEYDVYVDYRIKELEELTNIINNFGG